jgi:uncharacterized membrane protein
MDEQTILEGVHGLTRVIELLGIGAILAGGAIAFIRAVRQLLARRAGVDLYKQLRADLGRSILLGLELLVAADIINTVAITPTLESLAVLAGIVLIRTFLSIALEVEIDGRFPWQQRTARADLDRRED